MSVVYKAYDPVHDRYVAVKTISGEQNANLALRESFYQEAKLASKLQHPHILQIYNLGEDGNEIFLAMELLEGNDLKQILKKGTQFTMQQKLLWMIHLSEAIAYAHDEGVIHRDIKPGNLYVGKDSKLVVMDFGIARSAAFPQTGSEALVGTPDYISPEQVLAVRADHRADIFSIGVVSYELLTGKHPFRSKTLPATIHRILNETPADPHQINPQIPAKLGQLVLKAMERNVNSRFQNCKELLKNLKSL